MRHYRRIAAAALLSVLIGIAVAAYAGAFDRRPLDAAAVLPAPGAQVPSFTYPLIDGGSVSPADLRGGPVLIALWSTGCSVSRMVRTEIEALQSDFASAGLRVVVLADDDTEGLRAFRDSVASPLDFAAAPKLHRTFAVSRVSEDPRFRARFALPSFLLVDGDGTVHRRLTGASHAPPRLGSLRAALEEWLGAKGEGQAQRGMGPSPAPVGRSSR